MGCHARMRYVVHCPWVHEVLHPLSRRPLRLRSYLRLAPFQFSNEGAIADDDQLVHAGGQTLAHSRPALDYLVF